MIPNTNERTARGPLVLKVAAAIDLLIALVLIASPFVSARLGRPVTILIAATLAMGAGALLVVAHRLGSSAPPGHPSAASPIQED